jgi:hypothetical protein
MGDVLAMKCYQLRIQDGEIPGAIYHHDDWVQIQSNTQSILFGYKKKNKPKTPVQVQHHQGFYNVVIFVERLTHNHKRIQDQNLPIEAIDDAIQIVDNIESK